MSGEMKKIRVMIVEDSPVISALLEYSIGNDPRLEVCATAASAEDALERLSKISPDVIAMDIQLPGMDGLECTRRIMWTKPIPIVVVASSVESGKWNATPMEALRAGALAVLEKPVGTTLADYQALSDRLCTQLLIMSQVKLITGLWALGSTWRGHHRRRRIDCGGVRNAGGGGRDTCGVRVPAVAGDRPENPGMNACLTS
jgi:two-component system chemotaxis response regulator CheB